MIQNLLNFFIEIDVDKIRVVVAGEYQFILLDSWLKPHHWYHICVTNDVQHDYKITVFLNGKKISAYNIERAFELSRGKAVNVCFGNAELFPEKKFYGKIAEVNSWNHLLTSELVKNMASCLMEHEGNYIRWKDPSWTLYKLEEYEQLQTVCSPKHRRSLHLFPVQTFQESQYLCEGLNGVIFYPRTTEDINDIYNWKKEIDVNQSCHMFWTSIWNPGRGNIQPWKFHHNNSVPVAIPWAPNEPNGLHFERCGGFDPEGVIDDACETER